MESLNEKVSYLKGLCDGLKISEATDEGKMIKGILEVLDDMAASIEDLMDDQFELEELVDEIDEDLGALEEDFYDEDCGCCDDEDSDFYEIQCPACNEAIFIDDSDLFDDGIICPNCDEKIELDFDDCGCCQGDEEDEDE